MSEKRFGYLVAMEDPRRRANGGELARNAGVIEHSFYLLPITVVDWKRAAGSSPDLTIPSDLANRSAFPRPADA